MAEVVKPRPASTILLLRDAAARKVDGKSRNEIEVFMMVRHYEIDFNSGALVFPGGSVDKGDNDIIANPSLYSGGDGMDAGELSFRIAAIRETFEESGILLARRHGSDALVPAQLADELAAEHRVALNEGKVSFAEVLSSAKLTLALDTLVPYAHWITPVGMPKRFDTHFFMAVAPADQVGSHDGHESVDSVWVSPQEALDGAKSGRFTVIFPTERNLYKLARQSTAEAALHAARSNPVVTVLPIVTRGETSRQLRIPVEADYGGEVFEFRA